MAMPDNVLSSQWIKAPYIPPDDIKFSKLIDHELGGIAIKDPSQGLRVQVWTCELLSGTKIYVSAPNTPRTLLLETAGAVTEISLAFDQNMNPNIAYVEAGQSKLWWYDTTVETQVVLNLDADDKTPKICLDDKRRLQTQASDIILGYTRNNNLYTRMQRDRYTIEYLQYEGINGALEKIGMNQHRRLQFQFRPTL